MRIKHIKEPAEANDVFIGRPSKWGNPFVIGKDGDREEVIALYRKYLWESKDLLACLPELIDKNLVCYCSPDPCHGEVLARAVKWWISTHLKEVIMNIWYADNENAWLSNLAYRPFFYGRQYYTTVEQAYQSWKSGKFDSFTYSRNWSAGRKIQGNKGTKTDNNWNIELMSNLMYMSFQANPDKALKLIQLVESGVNFTHVQDKGIWREMFPMLLTYTAERLLEDKLANKLASNG